MAAKDTDRVHDQYFVRIVLVYWCLWCVDVSVIYHYSSQADTVSVVDYCIRHFHVAHNALSLHSRLFDNPLCSSAHGKQKRYLPSLPLL